MLLDLNTSPNVLQEGEPIVLPVYRTLLHEFGYSRDIVLAELEFELEGPEETIGSSSSPPSTRRSSASRGTTQRDIITAKNRASRVLHELDPRPSRQPTRGRTPPAPPDDHRQVVRHPGAGAPRVGADRARSASCSSSTRSASTCPGPPTGCVDLQGLAEECQKTKGRLWLVATSQEKLTDVVDSLEGKQTELAKAQDRFPIRVDLLPSDIDEVTGKRVLDKTAAGATAIRAAPRRRPQQADDVGHPAVRPAPALHRRGLRAPLSARAVPAPGADRCRVGPTGPRRRPADDGRLEPHAHPPRPAAPQQPDGRPRRRSPSARWSRSTAPTCCSRTSSRPRGATRSTRSPAQARRRQPRSQDHAGRRALRRRARRAAHRRGTSPWCSTPRCRPIRSRPTFATRSPTWSAEDRVRETDDGYRLQSPEQKDWEKTRTRHRHEAGRRRPAPQDASCGTRLGSLHRHEGPHLQGRAPRRAREDERRRHQRSTSATKPTSTGSARRPAPRTTKHRIFWAYTTADDTWDALTELHRSTEMIDRYDNAGQSDAQRVLLAEERKRRDRCAGRPPISSSPATSPTARPSSTATLDDAPDGDLQPAAEKVVTGLARQDLPPARRPSPARSRRPTSSRSCRPTPSTGSPSSVGPDGLGLFTDHEDRARTRHRQRADRGRRRLHQGAQAVRRRPERRAARAPLRRPAVSAPGRSAPGRAGRSDAGRAARGGLPGGPDHLGTPTSASSRSSATCPSSGPRRSDRPRTPGPSLEVRGEVSEWLATITGDRLGLDVRELAERRAVGVRCAPPAVHRSAVDAAWCRPRGARGARHDGRAARPGVRAPTTSSSIDDAARAPGRSRRRTSRRVELATLVENEMPALELPWRAVATPPHVSMTSDATS